MHEQFNTLSNKSYKEDFEPKSNEYFEEYKFLQVNKLDFFKKMNIDIFISVEKEINKIIQNDEIQIIEETLDTIYIRHIEKQKKRTMKVRGHNSIM